MPIPIHTKTPNEHYTLAVEFLGKLPVGLSLSSGTCIAYDKTGTNVSATLLSGGCAVSGTQLQQVIQNGIDGETYKLHFTAILTPGGAGLDEFVELKVQSVRRTSTKLIATPAAVNANSYATLEEANAYHDTHLYADTWYAAEDYRREMALIHATRLLDRTVQFHGTVSTEDQALRWPRADAYDEDGRLFLSDEIPLVVTQATAEFARILLESDRYKTRDDATAGLKKVKADVVEVEFDSADRIDLLPESVRDMLAAVSTGDSGGMNVTLVRV